jgi:hypothetical protein
LGRFFEADVQGTEIPPFNEGLRTTCALLWKDYIYKTENSALLSELEMSASKE